MESILKKFEKNSVDMSKVYGGGTSHYTGERSMVTSGGAYYRGKEYAEVSDDGCVSTYLVPYNGLGVISVDIQC